MSKFKDITGKRYNKLTAVSFNRLEVGGSLWNCVCDCGNTTVAKIGHLTSGHVKSCGCLNFRCKGLSNSPTYKSWAAMKARCLNPNHEAYNNYGGRGVEIHESWLQDFNQFVADVGLRPSTKYTLERRNNDLGYMPGNVVWATYKQQNNNRRSNRWLSYGGVLRTMREWSELTGISDAAILYRLKKGLSVEEALTKPLRSYTKRPRELEGFK